jgi:hypothetical protein
VVAHLPLRKRSTSSLSYRQILGEIALHGQGEARGDRRPNALQQQGPAYSTENNRSQRDLASIAYKGSSQSIQL